MKCRNCHKEIPDGAKSCLYCETKQDPQHLESEVVEEMLETIDTVEPGLVDQLKAMAENFNTAENFANAIFSGDCPACGSQNTETCDEVRGIENPMVGRCIKCSTLFCTDCGQVFENDIITVSSPECPACGSSDTDYPSGESDDEDYGWEMQEVVTCHTCEAAYCFACGKPLDMDDNETP